MVVGWPVRRLAAMQPALTGSTETTALPAATWWAVPFVLLGWTAVVPILLTLLATWLTVQVVRGGARHAH